MTSFIVTEPGGSEQCEATGEGGGGGGIADAGAALRRAREASGYSLGEVAARTRITERYLVALEASAFHVFPAALYAVGFAKSFARDVGISEGWVAATVRGQMAGPGAGSPGERVEIAGEPG